MITAIKVILMICLIVSWFLLAVETVPIVFEKEQDLSEDAHDGYTTGYESLDITTVKMIQQPNPGIPEPYNENVTAETPLRYVLPHKRTDFGSQAELESATPTTWFKKNMDELPFTTCLDVHGQALTYIHLLHAGKIADMSSSTCLWYMLFDAFKQGILWKKPNQFKEDWTTAATTLTDAIKSWSWTDESAGTNDKYEDVMKRKAYVWGLMMAANCPDFANNARASFDVVVDRTLLVIWAVVALGYPYDYLVPAAQTGKGDLIWALTNAQMVAKKISREFKNEGMDKVFSELQKEQFVTLTITAIAAHTQKTTAYLYQGLINGTDLVDIIEDLDVEWDCMSHIIKTGRQMWGIGHYDRLNTSEHFFHAFTGFKESDGGAYDTHGEGLHALGGDIALAMTYGRGMTGWHAIVKSMLAKQKKFTHMNITPVIEPLLEKFNFKTSINGMAEPAVFRAMRAFWNFEDGAYAENLTAEHEQDPNVLDNSGALQTGIAAYNKSPGSVPMLIFLAEFIGKNKKLHMPVGWEIDEFLALCYLSINFCVATSASWQTNRFTVTRNRYVNIVHPKDMHLTEGMMFATAVQHRFENVLAPADYTAYKTVGSRYVMFVEGKNATESMADGNAARPKLDGKFSGSLKIDNLNLWKTIGSLVYKSEATKATTKEVTEAKDQDVVEAEALDAE